MNSQNLQTAHRSRRAEYLFNTLRLTHDPFAHSSAELELQTPTPDPPFLTYFVDPAFDHQNPDAPTLLEQLERPEHTIIYGGDGMGKTTLRYALEAQYRASSGNRLAVSHPEESKNDASQRQITLLQDFPELIATDLFVQLLERFDILDRLPDKKLTEALSQYWGRHIPQFHHNLGRHLRDDAKPDEPVGLSIWWRTWRRVVVRHTPPTDERRHFLNKIMAHKSEQDLSSQDLNAEITSGLRLATELGYEQIYLLLDFKQIADKDIPVLLEQVERLLSLSYQKKLQFYLKLFLPDTAQEATRNFVSKPISLLSPLFSAIIEWQEVQLLRQLAASRFQSAGSWIEGIDNLLSNDMAASFQSKVAAIAQGSPQRLLQLISQLISTHAARDVRDPLINADDWDETLRRFYPRSIVSSLSYTAVVFTRGSDMCSTPDIRRVFSKELNVERSDLYGEVKGWQSQVRNRVLTVTGPPASGKSWFLLYLRNQLQDIKNNAPVFYLNISNFLDKQEVKPLGHYEIDEEKLTEQVQGFIEDARKNCVDLPQFDSIPQISAVLDRIASQAVRDCWPHNPIYLLVDGGDEPSLVAWKYIERELLEPISRHPDWRIIIVLRQKQRLYSRLLRKNEHRLALPPLTTPLADTTPPGHEQLNKLIEYTENYTGPSHKQIVEHLLEYDWSYPGLNHFLFLDVQQRFANGVIALPTESILDKGIKAITISDNIGPDEQTNMIRAIRQIGTISDTDEGWPIEQLAQRLDQPLSAAWELVINLQKYSLISADGNRYKIVDGVRQFVRAAIALDASQGGTS